MKTVLSFGMGVESSALLLRWLEKPASREFDLERDLEVTVMTDVELFLTLRYINAVRRRCDLIPLAEIPKGVAPDSANEISRSCPLARAIPNTVIALEYARTPDRRVLRS